MTAHEEPSRALAIFDVQEGSLATAKIPVPLPVVTIGQAMQNDVVLSDDSISRRHARLEYENGQWLVTDLASTNGTFLNGDRIAADVPTLLPYGANIRFGAILSRFRAAEGADLDAERARYSAPAPAVSLEERNAARFRFPLWAFVLLLLLLAVLLYVVL